MGIKKAWFGIALFLFGCSEYQPLEKDLFYPRDLQFEANGTVYTGAATLPEAKEYKLIIEPKDEVPELFIMRTCHRELTFEKDEKKLGFIPLGSNKYEYTYIPVPNSETNRVCPLRMSAFDSDHNQHRWAHVDFDNPYMYKLTDWDLICGGEFNKTKHGGVGVCQQRVGTLQVVEFKEEVRWASPKPDYCNDPVLKYGHRWEIKLIEKECLYHGYNKKRELMRLTTIGFSGVRVNRPQ